MTIHYNAKYDSPLLRGIDDPLTSRPWNLTQEIIGDANSNRILLDIGCGTATKLIPLAPYFEKIFALDPSQSMLNSAQTNISQNQIKNISLIKGQGESLPFKNKTFDVITCILSRWDVAEIHRVVKPRGVVIIEHIGCEDKKDFKKFFGKDREGWRGQYIEYSRENFLKQYQQMFSKFFNHVSVKNGFWNTFYDAKGIKHLLKYTPTIRNFDKEKDSNSIDNAIKLFNTPQGIRLQQNRILIYAKNI